MAEESQLMHPPPLSSAHTDSTAASLDPPGGSLILLPSGSDRSLLSWNGKIARKLTSSFISNYLFRAEILV